MRIISTINITNTFWFKSLKINKLPKLRDTLERRVKAKIKLRSSPVTLLIRLSVITMSTSPLKFQNPHRKEKKDEVNDSEADADEKAKKRKSRGKNA